jgi:hypothetical protein
VYRRSTVLTSSINFFTIFFDCANHYSADRSLPSTSFQCKQQAASWLVVPYLCQNALRRVGVVKHRLITVYE